MDDMSPEEAASILGVPAHAREEDVQKAFRRRAAGVDRERHPNPQKRNPQNTAGCERARGPAAGPAAPRRLALKLHPDKAAQNGTSREEATEQFQRVNRAVQVLRQAADGGDDWSGSEAPDRAAKSPSGASLYCTAVLHALLFVALTLGSLGCSAKTTVASVGGLGAVALVVACCLAGDGGDGGDDDDDSRSGRRGRGGGGRRRGDVDDADLDDDEAWSKRPRWERRWAKTEAKKAKRKETRSKVGENRRKERLDLEARERARKAATAAARRDRAADERAERDRQREEKRKAAEAAELAKKRADDERRR